MPLNATENYLRNRQDHVMINFAGTVATSSTYLSGPGGAPGDGYPVPAPGKVVRMYTWDGANLRTTTIQTSLNAGDRLSVYALYDSPYFLLTLRVNGSDSGTYCTQVSSNATLRVSLLVRQDIY
jgi:hypothetical protein